MSLTPIEYNQNKVLTTEQLSELFKIQPTKMIDLLAKNQGKFIPNKHYFLLKSEDFVFFKEKYGETLNLQEKNQIYLWTEKGTLLFTRAIGTDNSWLAFDFLSEQYFHSKSIKNINLKNETILEISDILFEMSNENISKVSKIFALMDIPFNLSNFLKNKDIISRQSIDDFIAECLIESRKNSNGKNVYSKYVEWCKKKSYESSDIMTKKVFYGILRNKGIIKSGIVGKFTDKNAIYGYEIIK